MNFRIPASSEFNAATRGQTEIERGGVRLVAEAATSDDALSHFDRQNIAFAVEPRLTEPQHRKGEWRTPRRKDRRCDSVRFAVPSWLYAAR